MLDDLASLVDKALVQPAGSGDRFQMLQTIRDYAIEELEAAAEVDPIGQRHAAYVADVAGGHEKRSRSRRQPRSSPLRKAS